MDNVAHTATCAAEHGLSFYIEAGGKRLLFDTGASADFADNAASLGIALEAVDVAMLSHAHFDHSGGMARFFELNACAPFYVSVHTFERYVEVCDGVVSDIGVDPALAQVPRIIPVQGAVALGDGLTLLAHDPGTSAAPLATYGMMVERDGVFVDEDFSHECYLLIEEEGKRILITGCAHRGVLNIVSHFKPDVLIGGFHLMEMAPDSAELEATAHALASYETLYYTCHCTGTAQYDALHRLLGEQIRYLGGGDQLIL